MRILSNVHVIWQSSMNLNNALPSVVIFSDVYEFSDYVGLSLRFYFQDGSIWIYELTRDYD